MYIDWISRGSTKPRSRASAASAGVRENAAKTGSRSCRAWPILFSERALGRRSAPPSSNAPGSKKKRIWSPDARKYASVVSAWSVVEKTEATPAGSNASTSAPARAIKASHASGATKPSSNRKPSRA